MGRIPIYFARELADVSCVTWEIRTERYHYQLKRFSFLIFMFRLLSSLNKLNYPSCISYAAPSSLILDMDLPLAPTKVIQMGYLEFLIMYFSSSRKFYFINVFGLIYPLFFKS